MRRQFAFLMAALAALAVLTACQAATPAPSSPQPATTPAAVAPTKPAAVAPTQQVAGAQATQPPMAATTAPAAPASGSFPEPGRSIQILIPFGPGGSTDTGVRVLAPILEADLGVPVVPVNREGAGGQVAYNELAAAPPDGYTIGIVNLPGAPTIYLDPERQATFGRDSFEPVGLVLSDPHVLAVPGDSPYQSLDDVIADAMARPGEVRMGSSAILQSSDISLLLFEREAGVRFRIVRFGGGGATITGLLGGQVDAAFFTAGEPQAQYRSGEFRILGVTATERSPFYPEVPTFQEQGFDVVVESHHMYAAPAGTPQEAIDALSAAIERAADNPELRSRMEGLSLATQYMSPAELSAEWDRVDQFAEPLIELARRKE